MIEAKLAIRFDIDTSVCMHSGVPALLDLADRLDVRFTFFANMGRAIAYSTLFDRGKPDSTAPGKAERLSATSKLGLTGLLGTILLNRPVGISGTRILKRAVASGHDLGLHGGRNHGTWQHLSTSWTHDRLRGELRWGIDALTRAGLPLPTMFASPGWSSPETLRDALREFGFTVLADRHDDGLPATPVDNEGLVEVATGMIAEPGGVGFIENLLARRLNRLQRLELYDRYFDQRQPWMVYDHPALAGGDGRPVLEELIECAQRRGYEIVPLSQIAHRQ